MRRHLFEDWHWHRTCLGTFLACQTVILVAETLVFLFFHGTELEEFLLAEGLVFEFVLSALTAILLLLFAGAEFKMRIVRLRAKSEYTGDYRNGGMLVALKFLIGSISVMIAFAILSLETGACVWLIGRFADLSSSDIQNLFPLFRLTPTNLLNGGLLLWTYIAVIFLADLIGWCTIVWVAYQGWKHELRTTASDRRHRGQRCSFNGAPIEMMVRVSGCSNPLNLKKDDIGASSVGCAVFAGNQCWTHEESALVQGLLKRSKPVTAKVTIDPRGELIRLSPRVFRGRKRARWENLRTYSATITCCPESTAEGQKQRWVFAFHGAANAHLQRKAKSRIKFYKQIKECFIECGGDLRLN